MGARSPLPLARLHLSSASRKESDGNRQKRARERERAILKKRLQERGESAMMVKNETERARRV